MKNLTNSQFRALLMLSRFKKSTSLPKVKTLLDSEFEEFEEKEIVAWRQVFRALESKGLIRSQRKGRNFFYLITDSGREAMNRHFWKMSELFYLGSVLLPDEEQFSSDIDSNTAK